MGQAMIYNRSIEVERSLPQYKAEVTTMLKDMDFPGSMVRALTDMFTILWRWIVSGKKEENRKALMDEFDNDEDNFDSDNLDS